MLYAIRRSAEIIREKPGKLWKAFTPSGWRAFIGLVGEPARKARVKAAREARAAEQKVEFESGAWRHDGAVSQRQYDSYDQYLVHQAEKLDQVGGEAFVNQDKAIAMFRRRFSLVSGLKAPASVICLGARRGEEVRALLDLGHFAIGIDLNPGRAPELVVTGDFHNLNFADGSVDAVYTNCLDHAFELDKVVGEIRRVLKPGGLFIVDLLYGYDEGYVVGNHDAMHWPTSRGFAERLAGLGGFRIEAFRDLAPHGVEWWNQAELRKV